MSTPMRDPRALTALTLAVVSFFVAAGSLRRALEVEPLPAALTPLEEDSGAAVIPRPAYPSESLALAVAANPFHPDRAAAPGYLLPGEAAALAAKEAPRDGDAYTPAPPPPPVLRLVGTLLAPGGRDVAVLQESGSPARMVRVGERLGTHTLMRVESGRAVLRSAAGETLELRVARPGS